MATPAVQLRPFEHAVQPVYPDGPRGGVDDLLQLVPIEEGVTYGEPPVMPVLVRRVEHDAHVRRVMSVAGTAITCPLRSAARVRYAVTWPVMSQSERDAFLVWLREEVQFTRNAWPLRIEGDDQVETTPVRLLDVAPIVEASRIHESVTMTVEQVFV